MRIIDISSILEKYVRLDMHQIGCKVPNIFPVINDANHGQVHTLIWNLKDLVCLLLVQNFFTSNLSVKVASGSIPDFVTSQDIPSPITFEEAHSRYATSVAAFITVQSQDLFTDEEVSIMP